MYSVKYLYLVQKSEIEKMKKKVLIIGGAGFIGSNLSRHLLEHNMEVYCFDMSKPEHSIPGVNYICGDFFDDYILQSIREIQMKSICKGMKEILSRQ